MNIISELNTHFQKVFEELGYNKSLAVVSFSARPEMCDFQLNAAFQIAKQEHKNPMEIATQVAEKAKIAGYEIEACPPAFVNIKLTDKKLSSIAERVFFSETCGVEKAKQPRNIIMDYGGANVAKELHVGHFRSPLIGESLKRLHKLFGDKVVSDAHLGDWGLQMGLTILQLKLDGVLDFYFEGKGKEPTITLDMLNEAYPKASKRKNVDEAFKKMADEFTLYIQQKKEPYFTVYKKIREVSVKQIEKHYKELNAEFDFWYGESTADPYVDETVKIFVDKGLAHESEGALVVDVAKEGENVLSDKLDKDGKPYLINPMPPAIIKKYNGGDLYATTDIATILMRNRMFKNPDEIIYTTDNRQIMHFEQVFRCCKLAGISPENQKLTHIPFGTMNGKDGKPFKTRSGDVVRLGDVVDLLIEKASEKLKSNGLEPTREFALKIGVGAMKFMDLSNTVNKDYVFDIEKALAFEGKTGPYIQYTVARINSILEKIGSEECNFNIINGDQRKIVIDALKLISAYKVCYDEYSLGTLCTAVYNLASSFSAFYNNHRILGEENKEKQQSLIGTCILVKKCIAQALWVLAIDIPERM